MTLTVKLDEQDRNRLDILIAILNVSNQSEAVRKLINDRFAELQSEKTLVERRGGHPAPEDLLHSGSGLSDRTTRKAIVAERIRAKAARRKSK